jgi:two-component sensor histidine kinase
MIHEKLYQSHNLSSIDFSDYLKFLLNHLIYDYSKSLSQIDLDLDIGEIDLNIETSIPCGLIINELVSNSLKYNSSGKITVKMHRENDEYVLRVGDEGARYLAKTDVTNNPLGLNLVHMLVGQLEGHMEILEEKGTVYQIRFQELKYEERFKT